MLPKKSAIFKKIFYNCNDTLVKFSHEEPYESPNVDCLSITAGMGTGVIKSDLQLSFVVTCGLLLGKNGLVKHNIYLSDEFFYIYNDNNNFDINAFANLGYKYNFSSDKEKPSYKGIEAGYLVRRSGDFFDKNTFRFGVAASQKRLNGKVYLYFPGGIKHAYPGISLFFNFF